MVDDPAQAAAERLAAAARAGGHLALTGGSTPRLAYERAAELQRDWSEATLWWGDERCVGPEHELSNYRLAKEALLDRLEGSPQAVQRIEGERGPAAAAAGYEAALRAAFDASVPRLDLVLLGVGPDGHCASLFPGAPALAEYERLAVGVPEAGLAPWVSRVTLTLPVLTAALEVVFLVTGAEKADAVARAFGESADEAIPASVVAARAASVTVLLDRAAGGL